MRRDFIHMVRRFGDFVVFVARTGPHLSHTAPEA